MTSGSLLEVQVALEQQMLQEGSLRFWKNKERLIEVGDSAAHRTHKTLIEDALPRVAKAITKWATEHRAVEGRGKRPVALAVLEAIDPDKLAAIGLYSCFNTLKGGDVRKSASYLGQNIEAEVWSEEFRAAEPKLFEKLTNRARAKHSRVDLRRKSVKAIAAKAGYDDGTEWSNDFRIKVGSVVLNCVLEASDVFMLDKRPDDTSVVVLTPDAHVAAMINDELASWMQPVGFPMVVPPRPWTSTTSGGYLSADMSRRVSRFKLVRTFDRAALRLVDQHIKSGEAQPFLDGINAIQATPFRINKRVMDVVQWAFRTGMSIKKLPRRDPLPRIVFPANYEEMEWQEQKGWRLKQNEVATINRGIVSDAASFMQDMWMAKTLADFDAWYLPHNVDFRGRIYPLPNFNTQRADYIRGMIEFSEGKPIGKGGDWLCIHLANCGDFDKISKRSFAERLRWVAENHEAILSCARDPKRATWWVSADAPFQFLAACIEYAGWCEQGAAFVSHLPIALDASNSGLQHYSAALRAEQDGRHVNLVPQDKPADMYQVVADLVTRKVEAERGEELADLWLAHGITRTIVKRNVMTFAYSAEAYGFKQQLIDDFMTPLYHKVLLGELAAHPFGEKSWAAAGYLAKHVYAAVTETVSKAGEGMAFLQKVASTLAHEAKPVIWTTPVGFPVIHRYSQWDIKEVELFLYDRAIKVGTENVLDRVNEDGGVLRRILAHTRVKAKDTIDKRHQRSAVAPNVIHSLDAAHLLWTVRAAKVEGINSFSVVHDSFATHACDTERFSAIIRSSMIEMYSQHDPFSDVHRAAEAALSDKGREKLPAPPSKGSLELGAIALSLYAFA